MHKILVLLKHTVFCALAKTKKVEGIIDAQISNRSGIVWDSLVHVWAQFRHTLIKHRLSALTKVTCAHHRNTN